MIALPPFLTDEEIAAATAPLTQGAARIKFLAGLGLKVRAKPNGQPLVGRAEFEAAMLARGRQVPTTAIPQVGPNWDALEARQRRHLRKVVG